MTTKERDQEIDLALHQMSSKVKDFIKEALANEYEESSNPQNSPEHMDKSNTANSNVSQRNNCATALKVRPPSGKRLYNGVRRNSRSNSAVAIKIPQTGFDSRPASGHSTASSRLSSARSCEKPANGHSVLSRPESGKSTSSSDTVSKTKSINTMKQLERHYGPLPWKPRLDLTSPVTNQCQLRVAEICGKHAVTALLVKEKHVKKTSLIFLHELVSNSKVCILLSSWLLSNNQFLEGIKSVLKCLG